MRLNEFNNQVIAREMTGEQLREVLMSDKSLEKEIKYLPISQLKNETHLTLWKNNKLIADLELQQNPYEENQLWLMHVAVRKGYEGNGYGKRLIISAINKAMNLNKELKLSSYSDEGKIKLKSLIDNLSKNNATIVAAS
jgi:GNAT superfamily N-acetyltransferase